MKKFIFSAAILVASVSFSFAQPRNNKSLQDENQKINEGVRSGQLTKFEAARLRAEQDRIKDLAFRFKRNDGYISVSEQRTLNKMQQDLDRKIFAEKHDRNTGYSYKH